MFDIWGVIKGAIGLFFDGLRNFAPGVIGKLLGTLGIAFGSYNFLLPSIVDYINQYLTGLPPGAVEMLAALNVDKALTLIFSAMAYKLGTKVNPIRLGGTDKTP